MTLHFSGRGGGGGGGGDSGGAPPAAVRTPDNLRSQDAFEIILGLCEGPISGLYQNQFYIGETLLYDTNGNLNFSDFILKYYPGDRLPDYTITPTLGGQSRGTSVATHLAQNIPVVRTTQTGHLDFIDIRLTVAGLYMQDSGGVHTSNIDLKLEYKPQSSSVWDTPYVQSLQVDTNPTSVTTGFSANVTPPTNVGYTDTNGFWQGTYLSETVSYRLVGASTWTTLQTVTAPTTVVKYGLAEGSYEIMISAGTIDAVDVFKSDPVSISGKTTSSYVKDVRFPVARISEPYQIRITKTNPDSNGDTICDISWESFQEILAETYTFPGTAAVHLTGRASNQFSSIPDFSGIYDGLLINVPTNYDPIAKTYSGTWDGTFKKAWSDNPAWCLYDFVNDPDYGIAAYYPIYIDKYTVYEAGQWCDVRVPDGTARYTFNALIADPRSGRDQAAYLAGIFNAAFFDDQNGTASIKVDKDDPALHIFTKENTIDGFHYTFTDVNLRYNQLTVSFVNPDLGYKEDRRQIQNDADIALNGLVPYDFIAQGCTTASEAVRRAQYKMITSLTETMSVSFRTNRLGLYVMPWEVILVADPTLGYALSGRVKSLSSSGVVISLRDPVYLEVGQSYVLRFDLPGSVITRNLIAPSAGNNYTLTVDVTLAGLLPEYCVFSIEGGSIGTPKPFRVMRIEEVDGNPDAQMITAIEINRNKWFDADNATDSGVPNQSGLADPMLVPGPSAVKFTEQFNKNTKQFELVVEPTLDRSIYKYFSGSFEVWSRAKGTGAYALRTLTNGDVVVNHPAGLYEFKILPFSFVGGQAELGNVNAYEFELTNPADPPADVSWMQINNEWLRWSYPDPPLDFAGFELRYSLDGRMLWDTGINATPGSLIAAPPFALNIVPKGVVGIMLKAVDYFGNYSVNAVRVILNLGDPIVANVVETFDFKALGWLGIKSNVTMSGGNLQSTTVPGSKFFTGVDTHPEFTGVVGAPFYATPRLQLDYTDGFIIGAAGYLNVNASISGGIYQISMRQYGDKPMYSGGLMYGKLAGYAYVQNPWFPFIQHSWITAGDYQIKVTIPAANQVSTISALAAIIDVDDVKESLANVSIASGGTRLPILKQYTSIKVVNLTLQSDGGTSYTARVLDKDHALGPLVKVYDLSGNATTGHVDAVIEGYFV